PCAASHPCPEPRTMWGIPHRGPARCGPRLRRIRPMSNEFPLFALSEEHQAIREAVRDLCAAKVAPFAAEVDEEARYPEEAARALQQADCHRPDAPEHT